MRRAASRIGIAIMLLAGGVAAQARTTGSADDAGAPARDQQWLDRLVGTWDVRYRMTMQPGEPPSVATGTERVRAVGDHWTVAETEAAVSGVPLSAVFSLGYDPDESRFHGTWIDSMGGHLWVYEGTLNDAGDTLTLETEGPSMQDPGETARYREVITITGEDTRTFSSSIELEDGRWMTMLESAYRRTDGDPRSARDRSHAGAKEAVKLHYLEIVTPEADATCSVLEQSQGVRFGEPVAEFGQARTAHLSGHLSGQVRIGVRAPIGGEQPVVRPYVLVEDIRAAVEAARAAGAEFMMLPTEIPGRGTFAIYSLGRIEHGLWQLP